MPLESGRLSEHRLAARQVMSRAVAKPPRMRPDVRALGDADLRPRAADVLPVAGHVGHPARFGHDPAVVLEEPDALVLFVMTPEGDFTLPPGNPGQLRESPELGILRAVPLAAVAQVAEA